MPRTAAIALAALLLLPAAAGAQEGDPLRSQQWNLDIVESDGAHSVTRGEGAVVAVIDTGVAIGHRDLQGRVVRGRDFVDGDDTPQDGNGHGTHVTGIVAANGGNGIGVSSVAPGARVLAIRVLNDDGEGETTGVAAGIDYAVREGADVINLSLSASVPLAGSDRAFGRAIERAANAGVVVVAAAGNSGLPVCENPSAQGRVLCVGAIDRRRSRSFFSSFGAGLGLVAPGGSGLPVRGEDVLSTYTTPEYTEIAGTSQAAPHVAGVAALLVSLGVRGQDATRRILATATDAGPSGPDGQYGAGIVNARAAVDGLSPGGGEGGAGAPRDPAPPAGPGSAAVVSVPRLQRLRTVLRRGILVRCRTSGQGRCRATATYRGRRVGRGSGAVETGRTRAFRVKLTRSGRRALARARGARVRLRITVPGADPVRRTVRLRR